MINYRNIFNMDYSYIGLIIIVILILLMLFLEKDNSIKRVGYSFLISGLILLITYFLGNLLVKSFEYSFFIEIITDNFFNSIIIFSVISLLISGISYVFYKYVI